MPRFYDLSHGVHDYTVLSDPEKHTHAPIYERFEPFIEKCILATPEEERKDIVFVYFDGYIRESYLVPYPCYLDFKAFVLPIFSKYKLTLEKNFLLVVNGTIDVNSLRLPKQCICQIEFFLLNAAWQHTDQHTGFKDNNFQIVYEPAGDNNHFYLYITKSYGNRKIAEHHAVDHPYNKQWNPNTKGLWLPGKMFRQARILTTAALIVQNELPDNFIWSVKYRSLTVKYSILDDPNHTHEVNYTDRYTDRIIGTFKNFNIPLDLKEYLSYTRTLDDGDLKLHYGGISYNVDFYTDTGFSIIAETQTHENKFPDFDFSKTTKQEWVQHSKIPMVNKNSGEPNWNPNHAFLTEKTYRTIYNHHPFIMIGEHYTDNTLEKLGFETYNKFTGTSSRELFDLFNGFPPFNKGGGERSFEKFNQRLKESIANLRHCMQTREDEIREVTEHNYNNIKTMAKKGKNDIPELYLAHEDGTITNISLYEWLMINTPGNYIGNEFGPTELPLSSFDSIETASLLD